MPSQFTGSLEINGSIIIKTGGSEVTIGATGSSNLSASYATTAACASNINISTIVPGDTTTSVVLVGDQAVGCQSPFIDSGLTYNAATNILNATVTTAQTASYVNPLNQNVTINGNVTASGDIRLTTAGNAVVRPIISLVPTGTASFNPNSTNTSTYSNYGINVISTVTSQSYCLRLPQTPTQGKTVTIINKGGMDVIVFPSMAGGDINGIINGYFVIPSDGKSYSFDCYENPLPGGWSVTNIVGVNATISTDVIDWDYKHITASNITFVNNSCKISGSSGVNSSNTYNSLPDIQYKTYTHISWNGGQYLGGKIFSDAVPTQNIWSSLDSVQILTNISYSSCQGYIRLTLGANLEYYPQGTNSITTPYMGYYSPQSGVSASLALFNTNVVNPWFINNLGFSTNIYGGFGMYAAHFICPTTLTSTPGTYTPSLQSPYASDNVGDPGTLILTVPSIPANLYGPGLKKLGRNFIGTYVHPWDGPMDVYYTAAFGIFLPLSIYDPSFNGVNVPNVKFRAFYNVSL